MVLLSFCSLASQPTSQPANFNSQSGHSHFSLGRTNLIITGPAWMVKCQGHAREHDELIMLITSLALSSIPSILFKLSRKKKFQCVNLFIHMYIYTVWTIGEKKNCFCVILLINQHFVLCFTLMQISCRNVAFIDGVFCKYYCTNVEQYMFYLSN